MLLDLPGELIFAFAPMQEVIRCSAVNTFGKKSLCAELQMFWDIYWLLMTRII